MTSEEWKERLPLIQAYINGETIQYYNVDEKGWCDAKDLLFADDLDHYRVKPKEKYRPFEDGEECFNEMMNHHPFGWVRYKDNKIYNFITKIEDYGLYFGLDDISFDWVYQNCLFADGTPFGFRTDI